MYSLNRVFFLTLGIVFLALIPLFLGAIYLDYIASKFHCSLVFNKISRLSDTRVTRSEHWRSDTVTNFTPQENICRITYILRFSANNP